MPPNWLCLTRGLWWTTRTVLTKINSFTSLPLPNLPSQELGGLTRIAVTLSGVKKGKNYVPSIIEPSWPVSYPRCLFSLREYNCEWEFRNLRGRMKDYSRKWIPHVSGHSHGRALQSPLKSSQYLWKCQRWKFCLEECIKGQLLVTCEAAKLLMGEVKWTIKRKVWDCPTTTEPSPLTPPHSVPSGRWSSPFLREKMQITNLRTKT